MKLIQLDPLVSVSDQITVDDISVLKESGIEVIICNRPDHEAENQLSFSEVKKVSESLGIEAVHIPFSAGALNESHRDQFKKILERGVKVHTYCRTGNRSCGLWKASAPTLTSASHEYGVQSVAKPQFDVVIVGAGSGGIATARSLLKRNSVLRVALIDPAEYHYYQPGWTMVGGGVFDAASTKRTMASLIPNDVIWIQQAVIEFDPESASVKLQNGDQIYYSQLVIAAGLSLNWDAVEGLSATLGKNGVTSNYRYDLAPYTWQLVSQLKQGKAIFTQPPMPIKCAGAPQKALYLSGDQWFKKGLLSSAIDIHFYNAGGVLFAVKEYLPALNEYINKYKAQVHYSHNLIKIDGESKTAWFRCKAEDGSDATVSTEFDMIHVCPPQHAPDFIRNSNLADSSGWLDVDSATLQHSQHKNIWGLGDVTNTPNAKTMAAARKQAPVVAQNICDAMQGRAPTVGYDGYGACPLTVERGKIVLAEFSYGGKLAPSFPHWLNDGTKATSFAWQLKTRILPSLYWHGMLKGRELLVSPKKR